MTLKIKLNWNYPLTDRQQLCHPAHDLIYKLGAADWKVNYKLKSLSIELDKMHCILLRNSKITDNVLQDLN